jgi:hypothetical protein
MAALVPPAIPAEEFSARVVRIRDIPLIHVANLILALEPNRFTHELLLSTVAYENLTLHKMLCLAGRVKLDDRLETKNIAAWMEWMTERYSQTGRKLYGLVIEANGAVNWHQHGFFVRTAPDEVVDRFAQIVLKLPGVIPSTACIELNWDRERAFLTWSDDLAGTVVKKLNLRDISAFVQDVDVSEPQ